jgi:hypothetical protein
MLKGMRRVQQVVELRIDFWACGIIGAGFHSHILTLSNMDTKDWRTTETASAPDP